MSFPLMVNINAHNMEEFKSAQKNLLLCVSGFYIKLISDNGPSSACKMAITFHSIVQYQP